MTRLKSFFFIIISVLSFNFCSQKENGKSNAVALESHKNCEPIKADLFKCEEDDLYIKLREDFNPSKVNHKFMLIDYVFSYENQEQFSLNEIIDINSFQKINNYYYSDKRNFYFTPFRYAGNHYFNFISKDDVIKMSNDEDTLYLKTEKLYKGVEL